MGEDKKYEVLMGKPEGKRPFRRPRSNREVGIRLYLRETGWGGVRLDSTGSGYGPVASCSE
jgi:hypothetical protein